jgi:hypothetical protein
MQGYAATLLSPKRNNSTRPCLQSTMIYEITLVPIAASKMAFINGENLAKKRGDVKHDISSTSGLAGLSSFLVDFTKIWIIQNKIKSNGPHVYHITCRVRCPLIAGNINRSHCIPNISWARTSFNSGLFQIRQKKVEGLLSSSTKSANRCHPI